MYETNDTVLVKTSKRASKLSPKFKGPYIITKKDRDIYTLMTPDTRKTITRHVSDLRPIKLANRDNMSLNTIKYFIAILTLFAIIPRECVAEPLFDRVRPIIWLQTNSEVNLGQAEFDVNFAYTSPCPLFRKNIERDHEQGSDDESNLNAFEKNCKALYILEWEQEIKQLLDIKLPSVSEDHKFKPVKPYTERQLKKREIELEKLNYTEKFDKKPEVGWGRAALGALLGPASWLLPNTGREQAYVDRLTDLYLLEHAITNATNLELFLARLIHERERPTVDPAKKRMFTVNHLLFTEFDFWETLGLILCPPCFDSIRRTHMEMRYQEEINKVQDSIKNLLK